MTNEEAIDVLRHNYPSACYEDLCEAVDIAIKALSAEPHRKKGKWEVYGEYKQTIDRGTFDGWCECSNCRMKYRYEFQSVNFCPNCGAYMGDEDV